jgi:hypothetical protein
LLPFSNACIAQGGVTFFQARTVRPGTRFVRLQDEVVLPQPERLTLRPFYRAEVYTAALHRASIVPSRHHKPHRKTDCVIRWNRFPDLFPFSSDNQSSSG